MAESAISRPLERRRLVCGRCAPSSNPHCLQRRCREGGKWAMREMHAFAAAEWTSWASSMWHLRRRLRWHDGWLWIMGYAVSKCMLEHDDPWMRIGMAINGPCRIMIRKRPAPEQLASQIDAVTIDCPHAFGRRVGSVGIHGNIQAAAKRRPDARHGRHQPRSLPSALLSSPHSLCLDECPHRPR